MDIQRKLSAQGLYTGKIDGVIGPETKAAIELMRAREDRAAESERQGKAQEAETRAAEARAKEAAARAEQEKQLTERESAERSTGRQATEFGKFALPIGAGIWYGDREARKTEERIGKMSPDMQRNMGVTRRFAPYLSRTMTRFLPEAGVAFAGAESLRESNPVLSEVSQAAGTGLLSAGLTNFGEGLARSFTAPDVPGGPQSTPPPVAPPQSRPAIAPPAQSVPTNAQTLINAARAAGAEGKLTKASAAKYLQKNITDQNRATVAKALRVSPGPNFTERLTKKVKGLSSSRKTLPGIALPFVAGAIGYDLATSDAEARGLSPVEKTTRGLATGTAAAGMYEGGRRIANKVLSPLARGMFEPGMAMSFDPLEGGSREATEQNISEARGQASSFAPGLAENIMGIPRSEGEMYSKAQVPTPNPARGLPAGADPDVAKAWRKSPRRTIIELSRSSGLDAQDIATLAGVAPDEVNSIMGAIPQQAMEMRASP
jgi:hypothetical protein